jgi:hypothetical protein
MTGESEFDLLADAKELSLIHSTCDAPSLLYDRYRLIFLG